jgi:hypothetical protein
MNTPYSAQPKTAFWRDSVSRKVRDQVDPAPVVIDRLDRSTPVVTAGSCFAQHIARNLRQSGYNYLVTEGAHPLCPPALAAEYNYGTFSARYGNLYVPRQLLQLIDRAWGRFHPAENVWPGADGALIDPFRPEIQPGGFASRAEFDADREQHFAAVRAAFERMEVFVFTLGLTETWVSRKDGAVFQLCPGVRGGSFSEADHRFLNLGLSEIMDDMRQVLARLAEINPRLRVILTVSPVPLAATATDRHVLTATFHSKSILRVACSELEAAYPNVTYFPSYEIIMGQHARGAYFADDLRSVTEIGVRHVMGVFFRSFCGDSTDTYAPAGAPAPTPPDSAEDAAMRLVCEEEALAALASGADEAR